MEGSINNKYGFSFVQVIISMGLLSIILLFGFKTIKNQMKISENSASDFELVYIVDEIRGFLSNPNNCRESFAGKSSNYEDIDYLKSSKSKIYEVYGVKKKTYGQNNFKIKSMRLESEKTEFNPSANLTLFYIEFEFENEFKLIEKHERKIPIHIEVNDIALIQNCYTLGSFLFTPGRKARKTIWFEDDKNSLKLNGSSLVVGKNIKIKKGLSVEGDMIVELSKEDKCDELNAGAIGFSEYQNSFVGCNGDSWTNLKKNEIYNLNSKQINIAAGSKQRKKIETDQDFLYCEIIRSTGERGICRLTPAQRTPYKKWILAAESQGDNSMNCLARCYY